MEIDYYKLYSDKEEDNEKIMKMKKIKKCTILIHGIKKELIDFYFCSCDPEQKDPICEDCALNCHNEEGHVLSKKHRSHQICTCGYQGHQVKEVYIESLKLNNCFFHEIMIVSKLYTYYSNDNKDVYCNICYSLCKSKNKVFGEMKINYTNDITNFPKCTCKCKDHNDVKSLFKMMNQIFQENVYSSSKKGSNMNLIWIPTNLSNSNRKVNFEYLSTSQIINAIFYSEKIYKVMYSSLFETIQKIMFNPEFSFENRLSYSNQFLALLNLTNFLKYESQLNYYAENLRIIFSIEAFYNVLNINFEMNIEDIWKFKIMFIEGFYKITLLQDFDSFDNLSLEDFISFSLFQRLSINQHSYNSNILSKYLGTSGLDMENNNTTKSFNFNIISFIFSKLESLFSNDNSKFSFAFENQEKKIKRYIVVYFLKLNSILKVFAKKYLMGYKQIIRYLNMLHLIYNQINQSQVKKNVSMINDYNVKSKKITTNNLINLEQKHIQNLNQSMSTNKRLVFIDKNSNLIENADYQIKYSQMNKLKTMEKNDDLKKKFTSGKLIQRLTKKATKKSKMSKNVIDENADNTSLNKLKTNEILLKKQSSISNNLKSRKKLFFKNTSRKNFKNDENADEELRNSFYSKHPVNRKFSSKFNLNFFGNDNDEENNVYDQICEVGALDVTESMIYVYFQDNDLVLYSKYCKNILKSNASKIFLNFLRQDIY